MKARKALLLLSPAAGLPAFPFFPVNLACGVTGLPPGTYAVGTLFALFPAIVNVVKKRKGRSSA